MQKWITLFSLAWLVLSLASPAWAESWVLWRSTSTLGARTANSAPETVGAYESKASCTEAAKLEAREMRENGIREMATPASDTEERPELRPLKNGQGYMAVFTQYHAVLTVTYFFTAECWPVGVNPR